MDAHKILETENQVRWALIESKSEAETGIGCTEELKSWADRNWVKIVWVPGHLGIKSNDQLIRWESKKISKPEAILDVTKSTVQGFYKRQ